ncbi:MAG: GGDEF domain-containing protein [Ktedonobacteraceae bacterium]|nr:GGDEF domain-containing protein [Ktedonobacteraceae bacterium]
MISQTHAQLDELIQLRVAYEELLHAYEREVQCREKLQKEYNELSTMTRHQQKMFAMVKELYGEQVQVATIDPVTSLPNHRTVMCKIDEELQQSQQLQCGCAILFIDLDHFKSINDTYGHRAGDAVLQEIARRLRISLRLEDFVGRYGGEEFTVVLHDTGMEVAVQVAERLRMEVAALPCTWEAEETQEIVEIPVTTSIGISIYHEHGETREALIEAADKAMYRAKHSGRNRACLA